MILDQDHQLIRDAARQFARGRLQPGAAARDRDSSFPKEELAEMGALGYLGMTVPTDWGGAGADTLAIALGLEEIAYADAACATVCGSVEPIEASRDGSLTIRVIATAWILNRAGIIGEGEPALAGLWADDPEWNERAQVLRKPGT